MREREPRALQSESAPPRLRGERLRERAPARAHAATYMYRNETQVGGGGGVGDREEIRIDETPDADETIECTYMYDDVYSYR